MAFLKFSRDRQGYEHFFLVQPTSRRGKDRPRLLYWFRTPPNVKVGREPFDSETRLALETLNPGVDFDWTTIVATPIPPADTERWRERRQAERTFRQAAEVRIEETVEAGETPLEPVQPEPAAPVAVAIEALTTESSESSQTLEPVLTTSMTSTPGEMSTPEAPGPARHRRRRRGRRGRGKGAEP